MKDIDDLIASQLAKPVVDRTGAEGLLDLEMHFAPDNAPPDSTEPSFFTDSRQPISASGVIRQRHIRIPEFPMT
jgi:uncharacterized protein (TIGR03435 family)